MHSPRDLLFSTCWQKCRSTITDFILVDNINKSFLSGTSVSFREKKNPDYRTHFFKSSTTRSFFAEPFNSCLIFQKTTFFFFFQKGQTPLHIASTHGSIGITELLVQYGCDINARNKVRKLEKKSNIFFGIVKPYWIYDNVFLQNDQRKCSPTNIRYICEIMLIFFFSCLQVGNTALHNACLSNNAHIVEFLIAKAADLDALNSVSKVLFLFFLQN